MLDIVMGICGLVLNLSLLPQLYRNYVRKSAEDFSTWSCVITAVCLTVIAICQMELHLFFTSVMTNIVAVQWYSILLQKLALRKKT